MNDRQQRLAEIVRKIAREELLPRFRQVSHDVKQDGTLVTEADLSTQARLSEELAHAWPEVLFLGEEMSGEEQARLLEQSEQAVWVLDPLDGTSNFVNGVPFFAVSLALVEHGDVQSGLVYDPVHDEMFQAVKGQGAWLNGESLKVTPALLPLDKGAGIVDYKRLPPELARRLAEAPPYSSQRSYGSVALDWCWIAAGRASVYLHGRQNLWDYASGWLILAEAGGHSCTLTGEQVFNHSLEPRSAVAAADLAVFRDWCGYLQIDRD